MCVTLFSSNMSIRHPHSMNLCSCTNTNRLLVVIYGQFYLGLHFSSVPLTSKSTALVVDSHMHCIIQCIHIIFILSCLRYMQCKWVISHFDCWFLLYSYQQSSCHEIVKDIVSIRDDVIWSKTGYILRKLGKPSFARAAAQGWSFDIWDSDVEGWT